MKNLRQDPTKVGIVAVDPLRVVGLQAILEETMEETMEGTDSDPSGFQVISLSATNALKTPGLSLVLIDADATEYLFHLIAGFRRDRPKLRLLVLGRESDPEHIEQVIAAGARGYLSYSANESEIRQAIAAVQSGSVWASREVLASLLDRPHDLPYPALREPSEVYPAGARGAAIAGTRLSEPRHWTSARGG